MNNTLPPSPQSSILESDLFRLDTIAGVIMRRWRLIAAITFLAACIGVISVFFMQEAYQATAIISIDEYSGAMDFTDLGVGFGGMKRSAIDRERIILSSRTLVQEVVEKLKLNYAYSDNFEKLKEKYALEFERLSFSDELINEVVTVNFKNGEYELESNDFGPLGQAKLGQQIQSPLVDILIAAENPDFSEVLKITRVTMESAVTYFRQAIEVAGLGALSKGDVLFVNVLNPSSERSRDIANALTQAYIDRNIRELGKEASQTMEFLETQLAVIRDNLENGEKALNEYKSEKGVFLLQDEAKVLINEISRLEIKKSDLEIKKQSVLAVRLSLKSGSISRYLLADLSSYSDDVLTGMVKQLSDAMVNLDTLSSELAQGNVKIQSLETQIDAMKSRISQIIDNALEPINEEMKTIEELIVKYEDKLKDLPETERQLAALARTSTVNAELYLFLLKSYEEARIRRAQVVSNVTIIDPAEAPRWPIKPRKKLIVLICMMMGMMSGIAIAIYVDYQIDPITSPDKLEQKYGIPVVTTIPQVQSEDLALSRQTEFKSPLAEATGLLRAHVRFTARGTDIWRILMTSPLPGEGKSTTSMNLAVALGASGERTLLIDCDLRYPRLHKEQKLDIETSIGLVEVLTGEATLEEVIHKDLQPNLDVMTAGKTTNFPAEILSSDEMKKLLQEKADKAGYRYVILDSPPGMLFADPIVLSSWVDGVYIVVRSGRSQGHSLTQLLSHMQKVNADIKGIILNRVSTGTGASRYRSYGYGKKYGYGYGYGYGSDGYSYGGEEKGYDHKYGYGYGYGYGEGKEKRSSWLRKFVGWIIG